MSIINLTDVLDRQCYRYGIWLAMVKAVVVIFLLSGCQGIQSALEPHGTVAAEIAIAWWILLTGACAILLLVMVLTLYAVFRSPEKRKRIIHGEKLIIAGGLVFPIAVITPLLIYGISVGNVLIGLTGPNVLRIEVIGHRWWWEVRYPDKESDLTIITANEIHIPYGQVVEIALTSADVIHSFWVPNLAGKLDLIPGQENYLRFQADRAGLYRGQCAEFCGAQHARMAFYVIAHTAEDFDAWLTHQRRPAGIPDMPLLRRGRDHFLSEGCIACHTIRGTVAEGKIGPDLTHVGSRRSLAAGTLENNVDNIAAWITDNQKIKPGNRMFSFEHLDDTVLHELATYLNSLQ